MSELLDEKNVARKKSLDRSSKTVYTLTNADRARHKQQQVEAISRNLKAALLGMVRLIEDLQQQIPLTEARAGDDATLPEGSDK